ncbi:hypothetical protein CIG75_00305 [Tumebacillus algifaecis]|uniref:Uncharacterized protein n=1 Tax=Tumebacillus algifaecis TaxID=1214604 RepID=A0A223CW66_9BACL|nr:hypothetical protein [Tumebacillus algifaecis]ASS73566.1 hypothetical protein CIG75_00305 [Tumebacillus algifaecis]
MWKFIDLLMVLSALGAFTFVILVLKNKTNLKFVKLRELFTGLFFIFWGLGDILNRDSGAFGMAFVGLGVIWLFLFLRTRYLK